MSITPPGEMLAVTNSPCGSLMLVRRFELSKPAGLPGVFCCALFGLALKVSALLCALQRNSQQLQLQGQGQGQGQRRRKQQQRRREK